MRVHACATTQGGLSEHECCQRPSPHPYQAFLADMHTCPPTYVRARKHVLLHSQAHPPFHIFARSKAMPILNGQHPRNPAWTAVSFPMSLEIVPETNQVMVGYGSGDQVPRVKLMPWAEVAALFPYTPQPRSDMVRVRTHACAGVKCSTHSTYARAAGYDQSPATHAYATLALAACRIHPGATERPGDCVS
jgi:hypothetical protein